MDLPKRKPNRLIGYDYSQNGAYFITICAKDRQCWFGEIVGATVPGRPPTVELSNVGEIIDVAIRHNNNDVITIDND